MSLICEETETFKNTVELDSSQLRPQAGVFCHETLGKNWTASQTTHFVDQNASFVCEVDSQHDPTYSLMAEDDCTLGEFLSRPFLAAQYNWAVGAPTGLDGFINPWRIFLRNRRVANRISNYRNWRGKLHVKFILNGNSFYYGRAMVSYIPYNPDGLQRVAVGGPLSPNIALTAASARPHIFLDPGTSQGGEMILPFFYPADYIDMAAADDVTLNAFGALWLNSMTPLWHTNGGTTAVSISVYVWATDVHVAGPTISNNVALSPQSGTEYGTGVISKPATYLADLGRKLSDAPMIGPYAMATSMAADAVGKIATLFGYSRPSILDDIRPFKPTLCGNLANYNANDSCTTLAMDSKQELTIDPRTVGLGSVDELAFEHIASKESLMGRIQWDSGAPEGTLLNSFPVTPHFMRTSGTGAATQYQFSNTGYLCNLFKTWRGNVKYRFQIVASGYHKGRIKLVFDANNGVIGSQTEDNTTYTRIIDIAEERDFTVTCGWVNPQPACFTTPTSTFSNVPSVTAGSYTNGTLSTYVLNEFVGPAATTNPIYILVYVSCPGLKLWNPTDELLDFFSVYPPAGPTVATNIPSLEAVSAAYPNKLPGASPMAPAPSIGGIFPPIPPLPSLGVLMAVEEEEEEDEIDLAPQSGIVQSDENTAADPSIPEHPESNVLIAQPTNDTDVGIFLAGENVVSLRQLMKRYSFHDILGNGIIGGYTMYIHRALRIPRWYGYAPNGIDRIGAVPANRCRNTIWNYVNCCYAGYRGAMRWKFIPALGWKVDDSNKMAWVRRVPAGVPATTITAVLNIPTAVSTPATPTRAQELFRFFNRYMPHGASGVHMTTTDQNPTLEIELPAYLGGRYYAVTRQNSASFDGYEFGYITPSSHTFYQTQVAVGEDFNCFFFLGAPPLWSYALPDPV